MSNVTVITIDHATGATHTEFGAEAGEMVRALVPALSTAVAVDRRERHMDAPACPEAAHAALAAHP